ncbi:LysE family transporter [Paenibacillus silvae]|uniref:LysE family transporter n=1 Tax=Paenibacillus silvae TaxID=1325358 RepID=UPI00119CAEC5|nr:MULTISPECIES: LysE family transporter [Paenibacillus]MCK6073613.1 LysE family transporter [Paenibacillus silvae]MCK6148911.1 LysE family transporter [Paenibacillus silvae]MCK6267210.1 LysE family transporter [Paenibacillus silvae]
MDILALITYAIVASFTPGPNNIISMTHAGNQGFRSTFPFISGVAGGCFLIMILCSFFNLALYQYIPKITPLLNGFGFIYMLYLAFIILKKNTSTEREDMSEQRKHFSFWSGFTLQLMNPKVIVYGLTALSVFVLPHTQAQQQFLLYSILLTLIGISANLSWALGGHLLQPFLLKHERAFHICMSLLLICTAISLIK